MKICFAVATTLFFGIGAIASETSRDPSLLFEATFEKDTLTADYAKENYARAYKRIQIIITFLHGEQPENVNLTTAEETADAASTTAE